MYASITPNPSTLIRHLETSSSNSSECLKAESLVRSPRTRMKPSRSPPCGESRQGSKESIAPAVSCLVRKPTNDPNNSSASASRPTTGSFQPTNRAESDAMASLFTDPDGLRAHPRLAPAKIKTRCGFLRRDFALHGGRCRIRPADVVAGERSVDGQRATALDEKRDREAEREQVVLESLSLLAAPPIHEEADLGMHQHDRAEHHATDSEGGEAGEEADDEQQPSPELGGHYQDREHRRHAHLREPLERRARPISAKPPQHLLRAVRKEDHAQRESHERRGNVICRAKESHVPSCPEGMMRAGRRKSQAWTCEG